MVLADSFYYQPVQIDTINTRVNADLFAKEGDANGRGIVVQITENGIIKDTTGITLRLQWSHISVGVSGFTDFEVVDATKGLYKLQYPTSMLHRGRVEAFIRITDNGILSGTRNLMITVERMVGSDETIEASDDFSALQTAITRLSIWEATISGKVDTWEADMEATKQLYIDTLTDAEGTYSQELVSLQGQLAEKADESALLSLSNQLAEIGVRVEAFGAVGDGVTDDSVAIQAALDSGKNVMFKPNKTYIAKNLNVNGSNFYIIGANATIKTLTSSDSVFMVSHACQNVTITGLTFIGLADGTNPNPAGINILRLNNGSGRDQNAKNIVIDDCSFTGFVFGVIASGTTGLTVKNCYSSGNKYVTSASAGGYFVLLQGCFDVKIHDNTAVAAEGDRHAVYVSCDASLTIEKQNENVLIYNNNFDWSRVVFNNFEAVIVIRSTYSITVYDNHIKGGLSAIALTPSHGDLTDVNIHHNFLMDVQGNGVNEFYGVSCAPQDKGGTNKIRDLKVNNNTIKTTDANVCGIAIFDVVGYQVNDNTILTSGNAGVAVQVSNCSDGMVCDNKASGGGTGRVGLRFVNAVSDLTLSNNSFTGFVGGNDEFLASAAVTNLVNRDVRSARIKSNGSGSIWADETTDKFIGSLTGTATGVEITFKKNVDINKVLFSIRNNEGTQRFFYQRSKILETRTLSLGIKKVDGVTDYPLATNAAEFEFILHN